MRDPSALTVVIRGAGGMATGIAIRLLRAGITRICLFEQPRPLSIHRLAAFAEAVLEGYAVVEGMTAALVTLPHELPPLWNAGCTGVLVDPLCASLRDIRPDVIIDATRSRHQSLPLKAAPLIIGLRPVHTPGVHAHLVVETSGPALGRVFDSAADVARPGTGGDRYGIGVFSLYAVRGGVFRTQRDIGEYVEAGELIGNLAAPGTMGSPHMPNSADAASDVTPVRAPVSGTLRGLLRDYTTVPEHARLAYIDPRAGVACHMVPDQVLAVGGGVLEAILGTLRPRPQPRAGVLHVSL